MAMFVGNRTIVEIKLMRVSEAAAQHAIEERSELHDALTAMHTQPHTVLSTKVRLKQI